MGWSIAIFCRIFSHTIKFEYYFDVRLLINVVSLLWNKPNRSTNRLIKCIKLITIYCQSPRAEYTGINASRIQLAQHAIGNICTNYCVLSHHISKLSSLRQIKAKLLAFHTARR